MTSKDIDPEVAGSVKSLSKAAASEAVSEQLKRLQCRAGTRLLVSKEDEALFGMQTFMREEHPEYQFFVMGRLVEVRRLGVFSDKYSLVNFPAELEDHRQLIQEKFSKLLLTTDEGRGWFEPLTWDQLSEVQRAICKPKFVEDNVRSHLM